MVNGWAHHLWRQLHRTEPGVVAKRGGVVAKRGRDQVVTRTPAARRNSKRNQAMAKTITSSSRCGYLEAKFYLRDIKVHTPAWNWKYICSDLCDYTRSGEPRSGRLRFGKIEGSGRLLPAASSATAIWVFHSTQFSLLC